MEPRWFGNHVAYTMAKYGMSMCVLGMAEELKKVPPRKRERESKDVNADFICRMA